MNLSLAARSRSFCASLLLCVVASLASPALAFQQLAETDEESRQEAAFLPSDEQQFAPPEDELDFLRKRIELLEKAEQKRIEADAKKKAEEGAKSEEWIDMSTDKWNVRLGGHVQMEYINWATAPPQIPAQDYFEFRRLRLLADGTGYGVYDFRLQMTLEPESVGESPIGNVTTPEVKDAYFSINEIPGIGRARVGIFSCRSASSR